jgi:hypothetical protein
MCRAEVAHGFPFVIDLPLTAGTDKPIEVSNLIQPGVQIALHYFETPSISGVGVNLPLLSLREDESMPDDPRPSNLLVEVFRLENGHRVQAEARWHLAGRGFHEVDLSRDPLHELPPVKHTEALDLELWIPQEESVRIKSLEAFLTRMEHDPALAPEVRDRYAQSKEIFRSILRNGPADKRRLLLDYWDRENEPGEYEVLCRYHPRPSDPWQQDLIAPPLRIRIVYEASWYDTLFKKLTAQRNPPN